MTVPQDLVLDVSQAVDINATVDEVWSAMIRRLSDENATPDNQPMPMVLEQHPGGRWYRDLGSDQGHLWGFVQVIKPPRLLEIHGPLFMSYAVAGHLQIRVTETESGSELSLRHRALGAIEDGHREGLTRGWDCFLQETKKLAEPA